MEKKIEALPSLSLEEFQEKKKQQRTKKKKILLKANSSSASKKSQSEILTGGNSCNQNKRINYMPSKEPKEEEKNNLVGSQKRKARKQNITRNAALTSLSKQTDNQEPNKCKFHKTLCLLRKSFVMLFIYLKFVAWCASPDLEALACLAAVAANRTKLTKS